MYPAIDNGENMWLNSLYVVIAICLNAFQRSLIGVGMNRGSVMHFQSSNGRDTFIYKLGSFI